MARYELQQKGVNTIILVDTEDSNRVILNRAKEDLKFVPDETNTKFFIYLDALNVAEYALASGRSFLPSEVLNPSTSLAFTDLNEALEWSYANLNFKTASGGSGASAFSELTGTIANNQVPEGAVTQHKDALGLMVSVKDFGAVGDGVTDDTAAIIAATANNRSVFFPAGVYLYSGGAATLDKQWYGEGFGSIYNSDAADNITIIRCTGTNSGNPFLDNLQVLENIHIDGVNKTGIGLELGQDGTYKAFYNWKNVVIRRFDIGIDVYNGFNNNLQNIHIQGNNKGIRIAPTTGTFNAYDWSNIHIADNTDYGILVNVPDINQVWQITNMVIERNGASGTFQSSFTNVRANFDGLYVEDSSTKPGIVWNGGVLNITTGLFSGSGGIDLSNVDTMLKLENSDFLSPTDLITNISSGTDIYVLNTELEQNDLRSVGANVSLVNTLYDGVTYNWAKNFTASTSITTPLLNSQTVQSTAGDMILKNSDGNNFMRFLNLGSFVSGSAATLFQFGQPGTMLTQTGGVAMSKFGVATAGMTIANQNYNGVPDPTEMLDVRGNIKSSDGLILSSPDGTEYKITVANGGTLTVTAN